MIISSLHSSNQITSKSKLSFSNGIVADMAQTYLNTTPKVANDIDYYGKLAGIGGMGAGIAALLTKTKQPLMKLAVGFVSVPAVFFGVNKIVEYISRTSVEKNAVTDKSEQ